MRLLPALAASLCLYLPAPLAAQVPCGGSFASFVQGLKEEALRRGHSPRAVDQFFAVARYDGGVIQRDRAQGFFQRDFVDFSRRLISQYRLDRGRQNAVKYDAIFDVIEWRYGVSRGVLLAFWALETDFGAVQGDFNTLNALVTLAHDCRRPGLFRPQVFAALELFERGDFDTATTGAWAGEIGQVQMLPADILENGVDGDGDGHVRLKTSSPDALMSGGKMLQSLGWRAGEPWLQEIILPGGLNWAETGLDTTRRVSDWAALGVRARSGSLGPGNLSASILLPMGRNGPAFIAYPNFRVFFEWNQSLVYVTTAAYLATRLEGAPVYDVRNPEPGLSGAEMKLLQQKLAARGYDVGGIDGILGARTRDAVRKEQLRLGLPADAWPTRALLNRL
ncbi:lytic murein transglycosylase [Rhodovulum adriaticum]|uniref:Lytic murein transglycosylase n=1 Tax=Rhodovulum adriaticum TaxID=35804 RepID=A0A4R2NZ53_RHOAD|nr:lytic murein transglycosylase [Rhodovulum adriaticum]MBK1634966.1 lytic transglycosylase [Rhodovulum adriaticum]TCP27437.1 lytic murein transglycosylase [Rhodovulum adriaticum]